MKCKIGIRPVVDPRPGVKQSVEPKAMLMAAAAKKLIESQLYYSDGTAVECVLSNRSISCCADAVACEEQFSRQNVCATLTVTPIFCYGTETMDFNPTTLKAVWGFNGTERPGAVYLACALSGYAEYGLPAFSIYGKDVQDLDDDTVPEDVEEKILRFARCAIAVGELKNTSYVGIGGVSMGIPGSHQDPYMLKDYFGMRAESVDMIEVKRRLDNGIYDAAEFEKAKKWVKQNICEGEDLYNKSNPAKLNRAQLDKSWETSIKMTLVLKDIMHGNPILADSGYIEESKGHAAICGGFQGQRPWADFLTNCDFAESILNTSFDWNGVRQPIVFATENDTLNGLSMLFEHLLTQQAAIFADVRTYWSREAVKRATGVELEGLAAKGFIHMNNSGAAALDGAGEMRENGVPVMKQWWKVTAGDIKATLAKTAYHPANLEYFRGSGFSSHYVTRAQMPMTALRLNRVKGIGYVLQVVEGYSVDLPAEVSDKIENRTDPCWPTTYFVPNTTDTRACSDVYEVMSNWGANHCSLTYGHIGGDVLTFASMLRIPVSMHNVSKDKIFRPHVWSAYGTQDTEQADFCACKALGALYK